MAGYLQPFHCVCCGVGATIFSTIIVVVFRKRNRAGALNTQFGRFRRPSLPKDFLPSSFTIYFLITRGIAPIGDNYAEPLTSSGYLQDIHDSLDHPFRIANETAPEGCAQSN
jgi:hypothetical protein